MWILAAVGSAFFAGVTSILAKIGLQKVNSHLATALRTMVVAVFAWVIVFASGAFHTIWEIQGVTLLFLVLSGLATGLSWICYFRALQLGEVNKVVPIDKASTVLTMLLAFLFLGEPLSANMLLGIVLITGGTYMMLERKKSLAPGKGGSAWFVYALLSAVFASLTAILGKIGIRDIDSNLGTAIRTVVVLVAAWAIVFALGRHKEISAVDRRSWLFILLSGLATGLSWLCFYNALQEGPASVVVPIDKLSILITLAFAQFFLKERLSRKALWGLGLLTGGTLVLLVKF